ncbi:hypothetical protein [Methanocaldococcus jannaschii]|nr:hypothetical protein [Methanocaldococcus jannaschii]
MYECHIYNLPPDAGVTATYNAYFDNNFPIPYKYTLTIQTSADDMFNNQDYKIWMNGTWGPSFHIPESGTKILEFPIKYGKLNISFGISGSSLTVTLMWIIENNNINDFFDPDTEDYWQLIGRNINIVFGNFLPKHFPRGYINPIQNRTYLEKRILNTGDASNPTTIEYLWGSVTLLPDLESWQFYDDKGNSVDSKYATISDDGYVSIYYEEMIKDGYFPKAIYLWTVHKESYLEAEPSIGTFERNEESGVSERCDFDIIAFKKKYTGNLLTCVPLIVYFRPCEVPLGDINKWGWQPYIYYFDTYNVKPYCEKFIVRPKCICYRNSDPNEKTITFDIEYEINVDTKYLGWFQPELRLYYGGVLVDSKTGDVSNFTYTFRMPQNTIETYEMKLFIGGVEVAKEQIIVERQKYCHSLSIEAKTYDKEGNETDKFPHPTSADYDENKHSEIIVKIKIKDEQGNYIDVPIENIFINWQYPLNKINTGIYEVRIPNTADNALNIQDYGIAIYIDKDWCDENGYYNKYNIEAENVIINSDKIERIGLWNFEGITGYENGTTLLNQVYETVSGTFVNPICEFSVVEQLNEDRDLKQYSYCYRIYGSPMTLNLPTYTDDELKELAKAIVREMGQPRKIETFTILSKELQKINSSITVDYNGQLISMPVYSVRFSLENSNIQIQIRNDQLKLLKDYLSLIK